MTEQLRSLISIASAGGLEQDAALLSTAERASLLEVMDASQSIQGLDALLLWFDTSLQSVLPHRALSCGIGRIGPHQWEIRRHIAHRLPETYFDALRIAPDRIASPILCSWYERRKPQIYSVDVKSDGTAEGESLLGMTPEWEKNFHDHGLHNAIGHGQVEPLHGVASFFNFMDLSETPGPRQVYLMEALVPHMHAALARVGQAETLPTEQPAVALTERELALLQWVREGLTNAQMAKRAHKSVFTVNNQMARIFAKLEVSNRTQAVSEALRLGLIV